MRTIAWVGIALTAALSLNAFSPPLAVWLAILAALTFLQPALGASLFFVAGSIDIIGSFFGKLFVSYPELELTVCLLALVARTGGWRLNWKPFIWGAPFLIAVFLSGLMTIEAYKVVPHVLRASEVIAACFLAVNVVEKEGRRIFVWMLMGAALLYGLAGLWQFGNNPAGRPVSFFGTPNIFAAYMAMLLIFCLFLFFRSDVPNHRFLSGWLAFFCFFAVLAGGSRSVLAGSLAGAAVVCWTCCRSRISRIAKRPMQFLFDWTVRRWRVLALNAAILGLAFLFFRDTGLRTADRIFNSLSRSKAGIAEVILEERLPYWRIGLSVWSGHLLFGVGPGRWEKEVEARLAAQKGWPWNGAEPFVRSSVRYHAHNLYIQIGATNGLLALLAFLLWIGWAASRFWRLRDDWGLAGVGLLVAFTIYNLAESTLPGLRIETGFLMGLAMGVPGRIKSQGASKLEAGPSPP